MRNYLPIGPAESHIERCYPQVVEESSEVRSGSQNRNLFVPYTGWVGDTVVKNNFHVGVKGDGGIYSKRGRPVFGSMMLLVASRRNGAIEGVAAEVNSVPDTD